MRVRAPATSANLGPGFDCAAVALDLWNELEVTAGEGVVIEGEGAGELAEDETNLALQAYALVAPTAGKHFRFVNRIPLERGLGSSAAAIALGLVAAGPGQPAVKLLALGHALESHADNLGDARRRRVHHVARPDREDRPDPAAAADRCDSRDAHRHQSRAGRAACDGLARGCRIHGVPRDVARRGPRGG